MGKRRRADAAAVSAENEKTQFTCAKLTLNKWLKGDTLSTHKQLKSALENTVQVVNQGVAEACLLANLHVLLCFETGGDREFILRGIGPLGPDVLFQASGQPRVALHPLVSTCNHSYQHEQGRRACLIVGTGVVGVYRSPAAGAPTRSSASGPRRCNAAPDCTGTSKTRAGLALSPDTRPSTATTSPQVRLQAVHRDLVVGGVCSCCCLVSPCISTGSCAPQALFPSDCRASLCVSSSASLGSPGTLEPRLKGWACCRVLPGCCSPNGNKCCQ